MKVRLAPMLPICYGQIVRGLILFLEMAESTALKVFRKLFDVNVIVANCVRATSSQVRSTTPAKKVRLVCQCTHYYNFYFTSFIATLDHVCS